MRFASAQPASELGTNRLRLSQRSWWQILALAVLYAFPALLSARLAVVGDADIWYHLRTAQWILHHHTFPHVDPFSSYAGGKPWTAYSWLFDVFVLKLYQWLGLNGLVVYTAGLLVAITMALHRLIRRLQDDFASGALLTLIAIGCTGPIWTPRSWMFSILFFIVQLDLLMQARRSGKCKELWLLPLLYILWANTHIEFVYGFVVLGAALLESVFALWWDRTRTPVSLGWLSALIVACATATLINPYGWDLYTTAFKVSSEPGILGAVIDLQPMQFRDPFNYGVLFLAMAAAATLARARRRQMFEFLLLIFGVVLSFHWQRDLWVSVVVSCAILAAGDGAERPIGTATRPFVIPLALVSGIVLAVFGYSAIRLSNQRLAAKLAETLPVNAANFVKSSGLQGPLFNTFNWGSYLMWNPGLAVSMDGRAPALENGGKIANRSAATWAGAPDWACDPMLQKAHLVMGPIDTPLTQLLLLTPHFKLAYQDKLAAVFVLSEPSAGAAPPPLPCHAAHPAGSQN